MLFIGLGNQFRGDDAFGIKVIESLKESHPNLGTYILEQSDLTRLLSVWENEDVVIVDAFMLANSDVGSIYRTASVKEIIKLKNLLFSSHGMDLPNVLAMAYKLGKIPKSFFFIGVQGKNWNMGDALSAEVSSAINPVANEIILLANQNSKIRVL